MYLYTCIIVLASENTDSIVHNTNVLLVAEHCMHSCYEKDLITLDYSDFKNNFFVRNTTVLLVSKQIY